MKTTRHRAIKKADQYLIKSNKKQSEKVVKILSEAADKSEANIIFLAVMAQKLTDAFSGMKKEFERVEKIWKHVNSKTTRSDIDKLHE